MISPSDFLKKIGNSHGPTSDDDRSRDCCVIIIIIIICVCPNQYHCSQALYINV